MTRIAFIQPKLIQRRFINVHVNGFSIFNMLLQMIIVHSLGMFGYGTQHIIIGQCRDTIVFELFIIINRLFTCLENLSNHMQFLAPLIKAKKWSGLINKSSAASQLGLWNALGFSNNGINVISSASNSFGSKLSDLTISQTVFDFRQFLKKDVFSVL